MLTLFSVPKPFQGHIGIIQTNAIRSWLQLRPRCEVVLLGDDAGTAEVAAELGVQHVANIARNEFGTPLLDSVFETAQSLDSHRLMAYVNTDIILMSDFMQAVSRMPWRAFVMSSRRWDLEITEFLDFGEPDWESRLRRAAVDYQCIAGYYAMDYFVFPRGVWGEILPFALGLTAWDGWLVYRARSLRLPVVDSIPVVTVVHQNHDYSHLTLGKIGTCKQPEPHRREASWAISRKKGWAEAYKGPEAERNQQLAGEHVFGLLDATWILTPRGLRPAVGREYLRRRIETLPILYPPLRPLFRLARRLVRGR